MAQPIRNTQARPPAYWETVRDRIKCGKAVKNLNLMLKGESLDSQTERATYFTLNKLLPSLQAIAVQVEHKVSASMSDLEARALAAGMDPEALFHSRPSITQEKTDSPAESLEGPPPPELDA
jgi:hypothetical protein